MATISRANLYHVPGKIWNEWTPHARGVFNLVYSTMRSNQSLFVHPKVPQHSREQWHTVAWNAGWCAARAADGDSMVGDTILDCDAGGVPVTPRVETVVGIDPAHTGADRPG